jgi:hypothetical protein
MKIEARASKPIAEKAVREFAERIRELRAARGWSQERLAEEADLHRTYVGGDRARSEECILLQHREARPRVWSSDCRFVLPKPKISLARCWERAFSLGYSMVMSHSFPQALQFQPARHDGLVGESRPRAPAKPIEEFVRGETGDAGVITDETLFRTRAFGRRQSALFLPIPGR